MRQPIVKGRDRPYADELSPDDLLTYRYRGSDPAHRDNVALRLAMQRQAPLIYFYGLVPGRYAAVWPSTWCVTICCLSRSFLT